MRGERICPVCKMPFAINVRYGTAKKYCSPQCKNAYGHQKRRERDREQKKKKDTIKIDSARARTMGLSYGQYMAMKEGRV